MLVRQVGASTEIVRVRIADGAERLLTETPHRDEIWPYWSLTFEKLVFQVSTGGRGSDLMLWTREAGEKPLTETPLREERWPAWSPTRPELVYAYRGRQEPRAGLALARPGQPGHGSVAIAEAEIYFTRPSFSPDGDRIVAQRHLPGGVSQLWLSERLLGARELTPAGEGFDTKPAFAAGGAAVVFSRRAPGGGPRDVMLLDLASGQRQPLLADPVLDEHSAHASPTRDEIAYVSDAAGRPQIYLRDLAGGEPRRLTDFAPAFGPRWSPDGELVAVTAAAADHQDGHLADPKALARARIVVLDRRGRVRLEVAGFMPEWMPAWP